MTTEADRFFGGAPGLSYPKPNAEGHYDDVRLRGVIRGGVVTDEPVVSPLTEMGTGKPRVWKDGRTREQLVVTLRCDGSRGGARDERNPQNPHDDGKRRLYIKSYMVPAVREALQEAGSPGIRVGGELYVAWVGEEPSKTRGFSDARLWKARYVPPTTAIPDGGAARQPSVPAGAVPADPWGAAPPAAPPPAPAQPAPPATPAPADPWGAPPAVPAQAAPVANPWG